MADEQDEFSLQSSSSPQKNAEQWLDEGESFYNAEQYEEALRAVEQALLLDANLLTAWNAKGNTLSQLHRYEQALAAFDQALHLDSGFARAYTFRGFVFYELGRYEEAITSFDRALALTTEEIFVSLTLINKADALYDFGRYEEALGACDQALRLDPDTVPGNITKALALSVLERYEPTSCATS